MVHVREGVHAGEGVVVHLAYHSVHHSGGAGGGGDFARVEDIEAEGVVGLVAGTVGDGDASREPDFVGSGSAEPALLSEGRTDGGDDTFVESEPVQQPGRERTLLEIPEDTLGKAAHGGAGLAGEAQGDIVPGEHYLVDLPEYLGLVILHPRKLGGGEVSGRVEQMLQAILRAQGLEGLLPVGNGAGVAPDDGGAEGFAVLVHAHQAVHLVGDTDGGDILAGGSGNPHHLGRGYFHIAPPGIGVLLGPTAPGRSDGSLGLGIECGRNTFAGPGVHQGGLDRGTAYVVT